MRKRSTGSVVHIKEEKYRISLLAIWSNLNEIKGVNAIGKKVSKLNIRTNIEWVHKHIAIHHNQHLERFAC